MSGKVVLNLAMSIDGYIADENGGYDWITGDGNSNLDTNNKWNYNEFLENIDIVVMGRKCYDQGFHKDYKEKEVYVATSKDINDHENYHFISGDICKTINDLKKEGNNIFLFGGGELIDNFVKANAIDEYIIGVIPTILGKGRRLFLEDNPKIDLSLQYYSIEGGVIIMKYFKINN